MLLPSQIMALSSLFFILFRPFLYHCYMNELTIKNITNSPFSIRKVEFWAATTIFVFAVFSLSTSFHSSNKYFFDQAGIPFSYYENYFFPQLIKYIVLYLAFLLFNFKIVPALLRKERLFLSIFLIAASFAVVGVVFGVVDTYSKNYLFNRFDSEQETYKVIFQSSFRYGLWLLLMFGFYSLIKFTALYVLSNSEEIQSKYHILTRDGLAAFVLWMVSMFLLMITNAHAGRLVGWGILGLCGILLYCYSFYALIPHSLQQKHPFRSYLLRTAFILLVSIIPVALIGFLLLDEDAAIGISLFNIPFQLLLTVPLSWVLYKRQVQGNEEIAGLKKELGQSTANFDFLRSQINPHFLFNALNTIYGTALQENAARTSEGIEKLGDMMRFMLQENMQERISLAREIEYLNNYISLQRLRTDPNPNIEIRATIECPATSIQIAPMLLIPFVENAFKHGISFREPSHISVTLEARENVLYFDVHNSKHVKQGTDPEENNNGIGLVNVKQRLRLLYPGKHELLIRETGKEFFVHLTLQFS